MATIAVFLEKEQPSAEERALHTFFQHLNFLFSFRGLRAYKAKYASSWEPRYLMHQGITELPAIALALARVSSVRGGIAELAEGAGELVGVIEHNAAGRIPELGEPEEGAEGRQVADAARERGVAERARPNPLRRTLNIAAGWVIAFACLGWIFHDLKLSAVWASMHGVRWLWIVPAIAADVFSYWCQGMRWSLLLRPLGKVKPLRATQAVYSGLLTNELFPMRLGELVRSYLVSRWTGAAMYRVFPSIAVERLFDGFWLCVGFGLAALAVQLPRNLTRAADVVGLIVLAGAAAIAVIVWRGARGWGGVVGRFVREFHDMARSPGFLSAATISAGVLAFQALAFWLVMLAFRLPLSIWAGAVALLVVHLGTALPNAPGNLGTYQFFCVLALSLFGVDKTDAAGFSLFVFVLLTAPLWAIGALALSRSGLSLGTIRREAAIWRHG